MSERFAPIGLLYPVAEDDAAERDTAPPLANALLTSGTKQHVMARHEQRLADVKIPA